jgi:hypothetical protein
MTGTWKNEEEETSILMIAKLDFLMTVIDQQMLLSLQCLMVMVVISG